MHPITRPPTTGNPEPRSLVPQLLLALLLALPLAAQAPRAIRVSADNDAFNFWLPPWDRTDREYTSGVRGTLEFEGALRWGLPQRLRRSVCGERVAGCATHGYSLGQAIYTSDTERLSTAHRPNAGWLFLEATERDSSARVTQEFGIAAGIVGPPALGEPMQRLFHALGPEYQRPIDWRRQLPFEPGFVARLSRTTTHRTFDRAAWRGALTSYLGGSVGSILTSATAGVGGIARKQLGGATPPRWWPAVEVGAHGRAHLVVRDEFLDGTLFRASERVRRKPIYDEQRLWLGLRWARMAVAYRTTRTGRQYTGQPGPAQWSSLALEWRPRG